MIGERDEELLLAGQVVQDAGEELGVGRGGANRVRTDAGQGKKARQLFGLAGQVGKCLDCQVFRAFSIDSINLRHGSMFPIP